MAPSLPQNGELVNRLVANAVSFTEAAKLIRRHPIFLWPPYYVNLYYAVELSFKSFLASRGFNGTALRKFGHDLIRLSDECASNHFVYRSTDLLTFMGQINGRLTEIRYLQGGDIEMLLPDLAITAVENNLHYIAAEIPIYELGR